MSLTPKQQRILHYIKNYITGSGGAAPTMKEIGSHFQMRSSASVHKNLKALEREGRIQIIPNVARGIRFIEANAQKEDTDGDAKPIGEARYWMELPDPPAPILHYLLLKVKSECVNVWANGTARS